MIEEIKAAVAAVVLGIVTISSWLFILAAYSNDTKIPAVVWAVAVGCLAKYGIGIVAPAALKFLRACVK